jgi:hypothetical protein
MQKERRVLREESRIGLSPSISRRDPNRPVWITECHNSVYCFLTIHNRAQPRSAIPRNQQGWDPAPNQTTAKSLVLMKSSSSTTKILKQGSPARRAHERTQSTQEQGNHSIEKRAHRMHDRTSAYLNNGWFTLARIKIRLGKKNRREAVRTLGLLLVSESEDEAAASRPKKRTN